MAFTQDEIRNANKLFRRYGLREIHLKEDNMENQHEKIKGYRDLTQAEIDLMNDAKGKAEDIGKLISVMRDVPDIDQRWLSIAQTDLQKGFMALVRAIARPTTF